MRVWSRKPEHAKLFAEAHGARATEAEPAVRGADVVVNERARPRPHGSLAQVGAHVNAVGSARPTWRELDEAAMRNLLVVDSLEAVLKELGDVILSNATVYAEVGEIFAGVKPSPISETTVFKSVGIAIEDIATAKLVFDKASQHPK